MQPSVKLYWNVFNYLLVGLRTFENNLIEIRPELEGSLWVSLRISEYSAANLEDKHRCWFLFRVVTCLFCKATLVFRWQRCYPRYIATPQRYKSWSGCWTSCFRPPSDCKPVLIWRSKPDFTIPLSHFLPLRYLTSLVGSSCRRVFGDQGPPSCTAQLCDRFSARLSASLWITWRQLSLLSLNQEPSQNFALLWLTSFAFPDNPGPAVAWTWTELWFSHFAPRSSSTNSTSTTF